MWQEDAESHLSYVSWPNTADRTPFSDIEGRYYFDDSDGKDVDVWIMDTGATIEHPVSMTPFVKKLGERRS